MIQRADKFGDRLLSVVVDEYASADPTKIHSYIHVDKDGVESFKPVTYRMLAHAVNATVDWLNAILHKDPEAAPKIAYQGYSDLRNTIILVAAVKTGITVLMLNTYMSLDQIGNFMEKNGCYIAIFAEQSRELVPREVSTFQMPTVEELLNSDVNAPMRQYTANFEDRKNNIVAILSTSGSTGVPKQIPITNAKIAVDDLTPNVEPYHGRALLTTTGAHGAMCRYVCLDLAYNGGIEMGIAIPIFEGIPIVIGNPQIAPHELQPADFLTVMERSRADSIMCYPNVLERCLEDEQARSCLRTLRDAAYLGGPLTQQALREITTLCPLTIINGSSETNAFVLHDLDTEDTASGYICLNTPAMGISWEQKDEGLYEPVVLRKPELAGIQSVFHAFPDEQEWRLGDLYSKHPDPTKIDVWKYERRANDAIVLDCGQNLFPQSWESALRAHPSVHDAVVLGHGRSEISAVIQMKDQMDNHDTANGCVINGDRDGKSESLWQFIAEQNSSMGEFDKLSRSRIILTQPDRPIPKTSKGGVSRKKTLELYSEEIEQMYLSPATF